MVFRRLTLLFFIIWMIFYIYSQLCMEFKPYAMLWSFVHLPHMGMPMGQIYLCQIKGWLWNASIWNYCTYFIQIMLIWDSLIYDRARPWFLQNGPSNRLSIFYLWAEGCCRSANTLFKTWHGDECCIVFSIHARWLYESMFNSPRQSDAYMHR